MVVDAVAVFIHCDEVFFEQTFKSGIDAAGGIEFVFADEFTSCHGCGCLMHSVAEIFRTGLSTDNERIIHKLFSFNFKQS